VAKDSSGRRIQASEMGLLRPAPVGSARESHASSSYDEDRALVARMLSGDERAFDELVARYSAPMYRFALARLDGDRELARETVQIAMTKALARLETYRGASSLLTWLCACCRNEILMHLRRRRTAPIEVELDDAAQPAAGSPSRRTPDPESNLLRMESQRLVHTTLDLLPVRYAQALEWKYLEQVPVDEIAARMGVRTKTAESLLTRARNAFRDSYERLLADAAAAIQSASEQPGDREPEDASSERD
jgi:RNA polymerase sigma-70 factor (ECF subfamily)